MTPKAQKRPFNDEDDRTEEDRWNACLIPLDELIEIHEDAFSLSDEDATRLNGSMG